MEKHTQREGCGESELERKGLQETETDTHETETKSELETFKTDRQRNR